ncbi:MAG: Hsp33 family molecular chaperone HslO [Oligoflexia bacterium]|nr:Hsp33 family molecular chaperone HslO [Oligoflexia bacterium]
MGTSKWIKCISTQGNIRGVAIEAKDLVQQAADQHGLSEAGTRALGEALMGALLIASNCKDQERVNLNIRGSGNILQALVDAHPNGTTRGYVIERERPLEEFAPDLPEDGVVFEIGPKIGPWGEGLLSVLRTKSGHEKGQPYIGTVPLVTGHLAKDLTFYWAQSEQIPSSVGLAVEMKDGRVLAAGAFLVQALPGATPSEIQMIESHIQEIHSLSRRIVENSDPIQILSQIFQSTAFVMLEERPLSLHCDCSWDRVKRALTLVGVAELQSMLAEDKGASVLCDFCSKKYEVSAEEITALISRAKGES